MVTATSPLYSKWPRVLESGLHFLKRCFLLALRCLLLLLIALLLPATMAHATLTASVDRTSISENDIIVLTIRSDQGPLQQTDFSQLENNFTLIKQRRNNQITVINGRREASYDLTLVLLPKQTGSLTIPAFSSHGESSQSIQIDVSTRPVEDQNAAKKEVFFDTQVSKQEVYVQEQLLYALRLYHAVGLSDAQITPLNIENAVIEFVGDQKKYETIIDGIRYSVVERQYAIFPEKSGTLNLPELVFNGRKISNHNSYNYRSNYNTYTNPSDYIRTRSAAHVINVLSKPANYPAGEPWLPTPALTLSDSWSKLTPTLTVGEPVTRTLTLSARNLSAAQLPDLKLPRVANLKMYPDQAQNEDGVTATGLLGQRSFAAAIVPAKAGQIELPAIKIVWWNTDSKQLEETSVAAKILTVLPATLTNNVTPTFNTPLESAPTTAGITPPQSDATQPGVTQSSSTYSDITQPGPWPLISLVFALLWLSAVVMWWRAKQAIRTKTIADTPSLQTNQNARTTYKRLKKACLENDAKTSRRALLDWFRLSHSQQAIQNLKDITQLYQDDELKRLIRELESHLYGSNPTASPWHGAALLGVIEGLEKASEQHVKVREDRRLKPLYPL